MRNEKITPLYERLSRDDELQGETINERVTKLLASERKEDPHHADLWRFIIWRPRWSAVEPGAPLWLLRPI